MDAGSDALSKTTTMYDASFDDQILPTCQHQIPSYKLSLRGLTKSADKPSVSVDPGL